MHKDAIKYKDVLALKGSKLWEFLTGAREAKDPTVAKILRQRAETSYNDTTAKHERMTKGA